MGHQQDAQVRNPYRGHEILVGRGATNAAHGVTRCRCMSTALASS